MGVLASGGLGGLEKGARRNLIKFNKCKVLPRGRNKARHRHGLGPPGWRAAWQRRSWWAPSRARAKVAKGVLGCLRRSVASRAREGIRN